MTKEKEKINIKSPQRKRCKTLSHSSFSSTGCHPSVVVNSLLPCKLPINNFSIFKMEAETNCAIPWVSKGKRKKKQQNIDLPISGQSKIQVYLTKTVLKLEDNTHNQSHKQVQSIPKGPLRKTSKPL